MSFLYPSFENQFNKTYKIRLKTLRQYFEQNIENNVLDTILDLNTTKSICVITGILFISTDLKTTIFDKLKQNENDFDIKKKTYFSKDIKYFLEDETATGMCLRIYIYPKKWILKKNQKSETVKIAFASGINIDFSLQNRNYLKIIIDYLYLNGIDKLVLFGNFFDKDFEIFKNFIDNSFIEIILVPDYGDFNCKTFPLLPVHKKLFKKEVISLMNPCNFKIHNEEFLFTSLFIIKDLFKYLPQNIDCIQESGDGLRMHFIREPIEYNFNHYHNKENTISCIPYDEKEIFFIENIPNYFVVPNYDNIFLEKLIGFETYVLTVPNFKNTHKIVVLDISTQEIEIIELNKNY
ncbi:dna polymerase delta regulatory subunit b [Vairimorpha apis BRL 01]|uniref:Dna polymerase delta regulatory subunit b n=1 Tax=Vairimorpha apis BRL 01 TaxID=1037528 RepID=T0L993_9MICR|nr:dna polymerase delta regulatory subunit b [Vairimorpha apis BRL 01]